MGNNERNPIESGLEELKEIIDKMSEKREEDHEKMKEKLEEVQKKLEAGLEKMKEEAPQPPKGVKEAVKTNLETMTAAYEAGMTPTAPGEAPAVGIASEDGSVPKFVEDIAAVPEKMEEGAEKIKETVDDAVKTNLETMSEAYAAGMTPTAPGEAPAVGIPEDEISEEDKLPPQPPKGVKEAVKTNLETMTAAYEAGMTPTAPGEGPAVGMPSGDDSVPKFVEDIAAVPEKLEEGAEKIKETVDDAVKTNLETMSEAYAAGMTPTAPGEGPAVGIPEDEIGADEKTDIPTPRELFETSAQTMTQASEVGMNPLEADPGITLPKDEE